MKNIKLTLASTLSVLALTFTGAAFADGDREYNNFDNYKRSVDKSHVKKDTNKRFANSNRVTKRVVVKNTPTKKVVITKTVIKKPAKVRYAKNKRFQHVKRFNKQYNRYQKRMAYENGYKRNKRYNQKSYKQNRAKKRYVYSVRPGDTLIQISYKTGVSIHRLARLNRIKNRDLNFLQVGQILRLV